MVQAGLQGVGFLQLPLSLLSVGSINLWGEAFHKIDLSYSKGCLGNAVAPTGFP